MIAVETVRHLLSLVVRLDDHFTQQPMHDELGVALDSQPPVRATDDGTRQPDGTYRFIDLEPGAHAITVTPRGPTATAFTWTPATAIVLPVADPRVPTVIEVWPLPAASVAARTLAIRGRIDAPFPAAPVAANQEVRIEATGFPPRNRKTRIDADREFVFPVLGEMALTADQRVTLVVTVPGRAVAAIDVFDGNVITTVPSNTITVPPGREVRAVIKLS